MINVSDILILILGLYLGLFLTKYTQLDWHVACKPFVFLTKIFRRNNNAKDDKQEKAPRL